MTGFQPFLPDLMNGRSFHGVGVIGLEQDIVDLLITDPTVGVMVKPCFQDLAVVGKLHQGVARPYPGSRQDIRGVLSGDNHIPGEDQIAAHKRLVPNDAAAANALSCELRHPITSS